MDQLLPQLFEYSILVCGLALIVGTLWKFIQKLIQKMETQNEQLVTVVKDNTEVISRITELLRNQEAASQIRHQELKEELKEIKDMLRN